MICTFFGHRDCPQSERENLKSAVTAAMAQGAELFYVGNEGGFDGLAASVLEELGAEYYIVCAYMPKESSDKILFPEGMETVHPRFAIKKRNRWMLDHSDMAITYICRTWGGAYEFAALAAKKGKNVVNIAAEQIIFTSP